MELFGYQKASVDFISPRPMSILAHEPGLGKSAIALSAATTPALIVCPASLLVNWKREVELWRDADKDSFEVVTYGDKKLQAILKTNTCPWSTLIIDEFHFIKNPQAARTKKVCSLIRRVGTRPNGKVIAISGTPIPNRPIEIWPLLYSMKITPMKYEQFGYRYAKAHYNHWGKFDVTGADNLEELSELMRPHTIRYTKKQVMPELPPKTWRVVALDLPEGKKEKLFSKDDLDKMDAEVAFEAMADVLHIQGLRKVPLAVEHISNILESGSKAVVLTHHRDVLEQLVEGLAPWSPVFIHGGISPTQRQARADQFQTDQSVRVFIGQTQTANVGLNLTAASHVVFVEASWVPGVLEQGSDRAHRIGTKDNITVDLLTLHRSIDEHQLFKVLGKMEVIEKIIPNTKIFPQ